MFNPVYFYFTSEEKILEDCLKATQAVEAIREEIITGKDKTRPEIEYLLDELTRLTQRRDELMGLALTKKGIRERIATSAKIAAAVKEEIEKEKKEGA